MVKTDAKIELWIYITMFNLYCASQRFIIAASFSIPNAPIIKIRELRQVHHSRSQSCYIYPFLDSNHPWFTKSIHFEPPPSTALTKNKYKNFHKQKFSQRKHFCNYYQTSYCCFSYSKNWSWCEMMKYIFIRK